MQSLMRLFGQQPLTEAQVKAKAEAKAAKARAKAKADAEYKAMRDAWWEPVYRSKEGDAARHAIMQMDHLVNEDGLVDPKFARDFEIAKRAAKQRELAGGRGGGSGRSGSKGRKGRKGRRTA